VGQAENIEVAHRFMETYAVGDPEGFVEGLLRVDPGSAGPAPPAPASSAARSPGRP